MSHLGTMEDFFNDTFCPKCKGYNWEVLDDGDLKCEKCGLIRGSFCIGELIALGLMDPDIDTAPIEDEGFDRAKYK